MAQPDTAKRARPLGDLGIRILSAAVFAPALLILAWRGDVWFAALISLMSAAGTNEFLGLLRQSGRRPFGAVALFAAVSFPLLLFLGYQDSLWAFWIAVLLASLLGAVRRGSPKDSLQDVATTLLAVLYVAGLLGHMVLLRDLPEHHGGTHVQGFAVVVFAFASMWVADTGAYLVGSLWGRRRIAPQISPGKSLEGALGAAILTATAGGIFAATLLPERMPVWGGVLLGFVASIVGLLGDLVESMFKRDAGIKDTSQIIPGHGGVLDRFDSVLFVGPLIYWALRWFLF